MYICMYTYEYLGEISCSLKRLYQQLVSTIHISSTRCTQSILRVRIYKVVLGSFEGTHMCGAAYIETTLWRTVYQY